MVEHQLFAEEVRDVHLRRPTHLVELGHATPTEKLGPLDQLTLAVVRVIVAPIIHS